MRAPGTDRVIGTTPTDSWTPEVVVDMLVRRPPKDVWDAFADPDRIRRWDDGQPLVITFEDRGDATLVWIRVTDFPGDTPAANAVESMSGFTLVLASLKMWLEHGIEGDLMYDKFPDADYADRPR